MSSGAEAALAAWTMPRGTVVAILLTAGVYARGFIRLHIQMPRRFPFRRLAAFLGGLATILIAVASPLAAFDDLLLQVHMIQHLLLMLVAPPLLLLGAPAIPLLRGLPAPIVRTCLRPALRSRRLRRFARTLTHPVVCWTALAAATWGWHVPAAYQLALRSEEWHAVEHACFVGAAILFWWPIVQPWPSTPHWPRWAMVPYLLFADLQNTVLAALLVFSDRLLYPFYASAPRLGGITPLDDQIIAGAIMWVPASLFFLVPAAAVVLRLLSPEKPSLSDQDIRRESAFAA